MIINENEISYALYKVLVDNKFEVIEKGGVLEHMKAVKNKVM